MTGMILLLLGYPGCRLAKPETTLILELRNPAITRIVLLEQDPYRSIRIDSASVVHGKPVLFHPPISEAGIFALEVGLNEKIVCIIQPGETIRIEADMKDFPHSIRIEGSPDSQWLQEFYTYADNNRQRVDSLQRLVEESQYDPDFFRITLQLDSLFTGIWEDQRTFEKERIRENPGSLASLLILHYHFGAQPVLSVHSDPGEYRLVDSALLARYPGNKHTISFHQWLEEVNRP